MSDILKGVRPLDYVLAAVMSALGVFLMVENITAGDDPSLIHAVSTRSWWIVPVFLLTTLPILWRRRNVLAVVGFTAAATIAHVLVFDWLTRCGALLPLSVALAYAVARFGGSVRRQLLGLGGVVVIQAVLLLRDCSADLVGALPIGIVAGALFYGIGLVVQNRVGRTRHAAAPSAVRSTA
jgi:hypothetical protein